MIAPWASFFNSLAPAADISISALCPMAATRMGGTVIAAPPSPEGSHPDLVAPTVAMMVSQEEGSRANGSIYHAGQGWYGRVELEPRIDAPRVYLSGPAAREAYKGLHVVVMGTGGKSLTELSGRMEKAGAKIVRVDINKGWSEDGLRAAIDNELGGKVHLCMFDWSEAPLTTTHPFPTKPGQPDPEFRAALADFQQLHEKYLYSTFKVCRLLYGYMRKQNYGRFVSFVRVDMGNEALGVIGPEWNSVAYGIQGLFQVLSIESEYFDFDIAGSSLYLHPLATVDSQNEGVRPGACLPVVSKMLEKGYRGRDMVIFNGTPYAYRSSPGSFLDIPAPGSAEKFGGLMFEAGAIMAQTVDGWDRASDVYAEGSFYPKDEPEVG